MLTDGDAIVGATCQNVCSNPSNYIFDAQCCDSRSHRFEFQRRGRIEDQDIKIDIVFGGEVLSDKLPAILIEIRPVIEEMGFKLAGSAGKI